MPELLSHLSDEDFNEIRRRLEKEQAERAVEREDAERLKIWLGDILASDPAYFRAILGIRTEQDIATAHAMREGMETWKLDHARRRRIEREVRDA